MKIGFTETEAKVILFLAVVFFAGLFIKYFYITSDEVSYKNFDYSKQDSLFWASGKNAVDTANSPNLKEKKVDSKQELLDFSEDDIGYDNQNKELPAPLSININKAGVDILETLPGIGPKTAEKIIALRDSKGGFRSLSELMEVKGIGEKKFNAIKKYVFIE